jgi:hypothetical protein
VYLSEKQWASGADRWAELVFCILDGVLDDAPKSRDLTNRLRDLGLLDPDTLAIEDAGAESPVVIRYLLRQAGLDEDDVSRAVTAFAGLGVAVNARLGGSTQGFLRRKGDEMRAELLDSLALEGIEPDRLRAAVTLWLQNSLGFPLSTNHAGVRAFCERHGITVEELEQEADALGLDPAVLDDLIGLDERESALEPSRSS